MADFQLQTFGSLWAGHPHGSAPVFRGGKACLLLAVLAASAEEWSDREYLAQLLWPSRANGRRRHSLRQLLSSIRRKLSPGALDESNDGVRLNLGRWWIDCLEFERAVREERWTDAAGLYTGPFGGGSELKAGSELRALVDSIQARLHAAAQDCLSGLIAQALEEGDAAEAERWARRFVAVDPISEKARHSLIHALIASDRHADALGIFEEYRVLLEQLVGDGPSRSLHALADEARSATSGVRHPLEPNDGPRRDARPAVARWSVPAAGVAVVGAALLIALGRGTSGTTPSSERALLAATLEDDGSRSMVRVVIGSSGVRIEPAEDPGGLIAPTGRYVTRELSTPHGHDFEVRSTEDGSVVVRRSSRVDESAFAWAPDGRSLLFKATILDESGTSYFERLEVLSLPDGSVRPFGLEAQTVREGAWSPKGTMVAISAADGADHDLYLFTAGGEPRAHFVLPGHQRWPVWSPSGNWVAFESDKGGDLNIYLVAVGDSLPSVIVGGPLPEHHPVWLADTLVAFLQGHGDGTELRIVNPHAGTGSRRLETAVPLTFLDRHHAQMPTADRVEGIAASPGGIVASIHEEALIRLGAWNEAGDSVELDLADITWSSSDAQIAQVSAAGDVRTLDYGSASVTASLAGWRVVTVPVEVRPLVEVGAETLLHEDWKTGIDTVRWVPFGDPLPYVVPAGFADGQAAFVNNGDGNYSSGVISREALSLAGGLTVEFWAAHLTTGLVFQSLEVSLEQSGGPDESGELRGARGMVAVYRTDGFNRRVFVGFSEAVMAELELPPTAASWHRYSIQVEDNGLLTMTVDGAPIWRGRSPHDVALPDSAYLMLGGRSVGTQIMHGPVTVYRGPRYGVEAPGL